jgi:hypothetical protein
VVEGAGAFLAWLGAALVVLSDGRRGLALGTFVAAAGIALVSFSTAGAPASAALALGGLIAGARRLTTGPPGWAIMPPGSTPRLVLCVAGGLVALWVGVGVMSGDDGGLRFAVIAVIGLAGARALASEDTPTVLTAVSVVALAVAAAVGLGVESPSIVPYGFAAAIAAISSWIPVRTPRAA